MVLGNDEGYVLQKVLTRLYFLAETLALRREHDAPLVVGARRLLRVMEQGHSLAHTDRDGLDLGRLGCLRRDDHTHVDFVGWCVRTPIAIQCRMVHAFLGLKLFWHTGSAMGTHL